LLFVLSPDAFVLSPPLRGFFPAVKLQLFLDAIRFRMFVHWGD
jgi:hypothetical protein